MRTRKKAVTYVASISSYSFATDAMILMWGFAQHTETPAWGAMQSASVAVMALAFIVLILSEVPAFNRLAWGERGKRLARWLETAIDIAILACLGYAILSAQQMPSIVALCIMGLAGLKMAALYVRREDLDATAWTVMQPLLPEALFFVFMACPVFAVAIPLWLRVSCLAAAAILYILFCAVAKRRCIYSEGMTIEQTEFGPTPKERVAFGYAFLIMNLVAITIHGLDWNWLEQDEFFMIVFYLFQFWFVALTNLINYLNVSLYGLAAEQCGSAE